MSAGCGSGVRGELKHRSVAISGRAPDFYRSNTSLLFCFSFRFPEGVDCPFAIVEADDRNSSPLFDFFWQLLTRIHATDLMVKL